MLGFLPKLFEVYPHLVMADSHLTVQNNFLKF
jgi:hypothetical protein